MITVLVLAFGVVCARVITLHLLDTDFLQGQGDARSIRIEKINAHRGMITDTLGKPLAVSSPVISLWTNPSELAVESADFENLAKQLGADVDSMKKRLQKNSRMNFIYLRRHLPPHEAREILSLGVKGVYAEKEYRRFYPAGEVTAHVVGFTDIDDSGQEGLELSYDKWLQGAAGRKKVIKNLYGNIIRDVQSVEEVKPGKDLMISLDLRIQYLAYRELKSAISHLKAKSGSVVILDVVTGSVLGMVNQPSYNPNNRQDLVMSAVRNRAVTDVFEPGSTVKPFTVSVALKSERFTPQSIIDTSPGFVQVGAKVIKDPVNRGALSLSEIIAYSSQVGISKLALRLNEYEVWEAFHSSGFGQVTGSGLPGESAGYLPNYTRWKDIDRAAFAYGYGLSVTPLQLANAYMTIAAGGVRRDVMLVHDRGSNGQRVMPQKVANEIKQMLRMVIEEGTGSRAKINSYSVAGKTGTVRKMGEQGYEDTSHIAFFAGMAPIDNPRLVGVVLINEPGTEINSGGINAAPIFSRIMSGALKLLDVPPDQYRGSV